MNLLKQSKGIESQINNVVKPLQKTNNFKMFGPEFLKGVKETAANYKVIGAISKQEAKEKQNLLKISNDLVVAEKNAADNRIAKRRQELTIVTQMQKQLLAQTNQKNQLGMESLFGGTGINADIAKMDKGIATITEKSQKLMETGKMNNQLMNIYGKNSKEASSYVTKMSNRWKLTTTEIRKATAMTKAMNFDFLTMLFGGMAMDRMFTGMFRAMKEGYTSVSDKNDTFIVSLDKLSNAFTYVKFSFFEAFANMLIDTGSMEKLTDFLIDIGDWVQDNPKVATTVVTLAGALGLIGKLAIGAGQVLQYQMMFAVTKNFAGINPASLSGVAGGVDEIAASVTGLSGVGSTLISGGLIATLSTLAILLLGFGANKFNDQIESITSEWGILGQGIRMVMDIFGIAFNFFKIGLKFITNGLALLVTNTINSIGQGYDIVAGFLKKVLNIDLGSFDEIIKTVEDKLEETRKTSEGLGNDMYWFQGGVDIANEMDAETRKATELATGLSLGATEAIAFKASNDELSSSLTNLNTPLDNTINSFMGQNGLVTGMNETTLAQGDYVKNLNEALFPALSAEGTKVDTLASKYRALAKAKSDAKSGTSDNNFMNQSTRYSTVN